MSFCSSLFKKHRESSDIHTFTNHTLATTPLSPSLLPHFSPMSYSSASHTFNGTSHASNVRRQGQDSNSNSSVSLSATAARLSGPGMPVNNRARPSLASRLFQFANASSASASASAGSETSSGHLAPHHQGSPSYQSIQVSQQESYSRLRDHLFPASTAPTAPTFHGNGNGNVLASSIPTHRSSQRSSPSSRFQQMVQSAVLHNSHSLADRLASSRDFYQMPGAGPTPGNPTFSPSASSSTPNASVRGRHPRSAAMANSIAAMHPSFRSKAVCMLKCGFCTSEICKRGMRAILLADTSVELYSTDDVTKGRVQLVGEDYLTENCQCKIRDVACLGCGNVVGYHVTQPCELCLGSCNNGHFWMFLSDYVKAKERLDSTGKQALVWAHLLDCAEVVETVYR